MPSIQVKDVPPDTHSVLKRRAAQAHQSLQEYLLELLVSQAAQPTLDEVLDRAAGRAGGDLPLAEAADILRVDRDRR
jgi:plasmid stability protein